MVYSHEEYYKRRPNELFDDHTKRIVFMRPGQCFGCRNTKLLGKSTFFGKRIWCCDKCRPIIRKWEKDMKEGKIRR